MPLLAHHHTNMEEKVHKSAEDSQHVESSSGFNVSESHVIQGGRIVSNDREPYGKAGEWACTDAPCDLDTDNSNRLRWNL